LFNLAALRGVRKTVTETTLAASNLAISVKGMRWLEFGNPWSEGQDCGLEFIVIRNG